MSRVALITGAWAPRVPDAWSGLGRGLALRLAGDGCAVGLVARREERLRELAREIEASGGRAAVLPCDVSERKEVRAAVEGCRRELGEVDLLVANAGVSENTFPDHVDYGHRGTARGGTTRPGSVVARPTTRLRRAVPRGVGRVVAERRGRIGSRMRREKGR